MKPMDRALRSWLLC